MSAYLLPLSGGGAIPLRRSRVYLGRAAGVDRDQPINRETAICLLEYTGSLWYVEDLRSPKGIRVNGITCKRQALQPDDEIEIGSKRYRISFSAPKYTFGRTSSGQMRVSKRQKPSTKSRSALVTGFPARLVPLAGGPEIVISNSPVTVGRRPPCDVVIPHKTISSEHCRLENIDGFWHVTDLGSRNGTRIDGLPCESGWVGPGTRLTIGDQRYTLEYAAQGAPPRNEVDVDSEAARRNREALYRQLEQFSDESDTPTPGRWNVSID